jgi:hypothetical protein
MRVGSLRVNRRPLLLIPTVVVLTAQPVWAQEGVSYFLPRSVVRVRATKTTTTTVKPAANLSKVESDVDRTVVYEVSVESTADTAQSFQLAHNASFWKSKEIEVRLTSAGLLSGFNAEAKGQGGAVISGLLRGVASLAGLFAFDQAAGRPAWPDPVTECRDLRLEAVILDIQAFVKRTEQGCTLWRALATNANAHDEWEQRLANATKRLETSAGAGFAQALEVVRSHRQHLETLAATRERYETEFKAALKAFRTEQGFRQDEQSETREFHFALAEVPGEADMSKLIEKAAAGAGDPTFGHMLALMQWADLAITKDAIGTAATAAATMPAGKDDLLVRYRRSRPFRLAAWQKDPEVGSWGANQVKVVQAFDASDPILLLRLPLSAWSDRRLEAEFDSVGQPQRVKTFSTAKGPAIAAAVASAATEASGAYKASLDQLLAIRKAGHALDTEDLTQRLSDLKQRKEVVDARTALQGAETTAADRQRKHELDAEIDRVQSELRLRQQEATFDLRLEIDVLKAEVDRLAQQLLKLKAERDLTGK